MNVTRQHLRENIADLIGDRPLSARSVLATALLGADEPHLTVAELVGMASLFGISDGAARTCLWRMVSGGELTADDGTYALAGPLLERRQRVDEAARTDVGPWDGTWELAIVSLERRSAADRLALRKAAVALHLAELREGLWIRPDNLDRERLPTSRAVLESQCVHFHGATTDAPAGLMRSLFDLDVWSRDARRLVAAMTTELDGEADDFRYLFLLSVAAVRHLQLDPMLPDELNPDDWPGHELRNTYRRFDEFFKRRLPSSR